MSTAKADIIARLQKEILPLQGYRPVLQRGEQDPGLALIGRAFPNGVFPTGAIHEFCCGAEEEEAATGGFIAGVLSALMKNKGSALWVSRSHRVFPPALGYFGLAPERVIFVHLRREKDLLWVTEEALKCGGLTAVVGEINEFSFMASRRFQLAVEESSVTGFVIRGRLRQLNTTASVSRWQISPLPSSMVDDLPGVGFPRWQADLVRVRNGRPASWQIEWRKGKFNQIPAATLATLEQVQKKTG